MTTGQGPVTRQAFPARLPQLDIHTLSEEWLLTHAAQEHWELVAAALGRPPSRWIDRDGDRAYAAVMMAETRFDLAHPVGEDDPLEIETRFEAVQRPHALSLTRVTVAGAVRAEARLLTSLVKRRERGSNKRFAKVRDLWGEPDRDVPAIDDLLQAHHARKGAAGGALAMEHEVVRIRDFNAADFMYFRNCVSVARAAEWREGRGGPTRLTAARRAFFFGNVEDGEVVEALVARDGDAVGTVLRARSDGRLLLVSEATAPRTAIAPR